MTFPWKNADLENLGSKRKHKLKVLFNKEPVWDRIIRTLNKKRRWLRPSEVHVSSPAHHSSPYDRNNSVANESNDNDENMTDNKWEGSIASKMSKHVRSRQAPFSNSAINSNESKHLRKNCLSSDNKEASKRPNYKSSLQFQSNQDIFNHEPKSKYGFRNLSIQKS